MLRARITLFLLCLSGWAQYASAQDDVFGDLHTGVSAKKEGVIIGLNGALDLPAADMAKRFGPGYRIGPSLMYKTVSNWMFGAKADFIFGSSVKEDSLLVNVFTSSGTIIDNTGIAKNLGIFERGYAIGLQAGKILPFKKNSDVNGLLLLTGVGFVQHRIRLFDRDKTIPQVAGEYAKGYDRLTNGIYVEQFIGLNHFGANRLVNFHIGFDVMVGFTAGRRDFLYDVQRPGNESRTDILFGLRGGWYIPIFKRKAEDIYF